MTRDSRRVDSASPACPRVGSDAAAGTLTEAELLEKITQDRPVVGLSNGQVRRATSRFADWCDLHGLSAAPTDEETLLLYLHSRRHDLAPDTAGSEARNIAWGLTVAGHPSPIGERTYRYLSARRREPRQPDPLVDDFTIDEIERMITASREHGMPRPVLCIRAAIVIGWYLAKSATSRNVPLPSMPLRLPFHIPADHIHVTTRDIKITEPRSSFRVMIDRESDPVGYDAVLSALKSASDSPRESTYPLKPQRHKVNLIADLVSKRWLDSTGVSQAPEWTPTLAATSIEERNWVVRETQPLHWKRVSERAYLLVGVVTARRHAELSRLLIRDIEPLPGGAYRFTIGENEKGNLLASRYGGPARYGTYLIDHLPTDTNEGQATQERASSVCSAICPACALAEHLAMRTRQGGADGDPLFVTQWGTPMSRTQDGRIMVRKMWDRLPEPKPEKRIGSRSLRVTGRTLAARAGMSDHDAADLLLATPQVARRYNRHNPNPDGVALSLDGPVE